MFLVALGIDYNIFLMTRVREESLTYGTRQGVVRGFVGYGRGHHLGGDRARRDLRSARGDPDHVPRSQLAFIVTFGVLLDTFVVRSLLVPALELDLGKLIWWPSALWRRGRD